MLRGSRRADGGGARARSAVREVDRSAVLQRLRATSELSTLCLRDFSVLSSLEVRGIITTKHAAELTRALAAARRPGARTSFLRHDTTLRG
jgi:hypothetical protein